MDPRKVDWQNIERRIDCWNPKQKLLDKKEISERRSKTIDKPKRKHTIRNPEDNGNPIKKPHNHQTLWW